MRASSIDAHHSASLPRVSTEVWSFTPRLPGATFTIYASLRPSLNLSNYCNLSCQAASSISLCEASNCAEASQRPNLCLSKGGSTNFNPMAAFSKASHSWQASDSAVSTATEPAFAMEAPGCDLLVRLKLWDPFRASFRFRTFVARSLAACFPRQAQA